MNEKYQVYQVNPAGQWLIAECSTHDDAIWIAKALKHQCHRDGYTYDSFEVVSPDGEHIRIGDWDWNK